MGDESDDKLPAMPSVPTVKTGGDMLDRPDLAVGSLFSTLRVAKRTDALSKTMAAKRMERDLDQAQSFTRERAPVPVPLMKSQSTAGRQNAQDSFHLLPPSRLGTDPPTPSLRSVSGKAGGPNDLASLLPAANTNYASRSSNTGDAAQGGAPDDRLPSASFRHGDSTSGKDSLGEQGLQHDPSFVRDPGNLLAATWAFHKVTADGGVGIDFQQLLISPPEHLEQIHEALNETLLEESESEPSTATALDEPEGKPFTPEEFPMDLLPAPSSWRDVPAPVSPDGAPDGPGAGGSLRSPGSSLPKIRGSHLGGSIRDEVPDASAAKAATAALLNASIRSQQAGESLKAEKVAAAGNPELLRSLRQQERAERMNCTIRVGFIKGKIKPLSIVVMVVGTRGDVQPFVGICLKLKEYGHRVRIATHAVFREFVESFGLEFYPIGGDPKVLSEFVVKHRGIMPGLDIKDALNQRDQVKQILYSTWGACVDPDPAHPDKPFRAQAIVSNPPVYGHIHCAEALNVPLHMVFTMPWTPTKSFPQPFARIKTTLGEGQGKAREIMNWLSYFAVEDLTWLGMSGMIKDFRQSVLKLTQWNKYTTSHATYYSKVPMTYVWSPSMVARPRDWPSYIEVVGFINVELNKLTAFTPPKELTDFMKNGPPPIYIGFGSLVMDEPEKLTKQFLTAIEAIGARAIIQRGWGGLGAGVKKVPDTVLFIDGCPHDWLFPHMAAVVHHGGAGTTATGLYAGKPTFIVPFFGDQPFWGAACFQCGVGPEPVAIDNLTTPRITEALKDLLMPGRQKKALEMSAKMQKEDGIAATVDHLHRTIYEATLAGRSPVWMKPKAPEEVGMLTTISELPAEQARRGGISEDQDDGSFLQGMLHLFGKGKKKAADSKQAPSPPGLPRGDSKNSRSQPSLAHLAGTPSPTSSTSLPPKRASDGGAASERSASMPPGGPPIIAESKRGGFFSFLGC